MDNNLQDENFDPKVNIKFKFYGVNKNQTGSEVVYTTNLEVHSRDSIDQIKKMLCLEILKDEKKFNKVFNYKNKKTSKKPSPKAPSPKAPSPKKSTPVEEDIQIDVEDDIEEDIEDALYESESEVEVDAQHMSYLHDFGDDSDMEGGSRKSNLTPIPTTLYFWNDEIGQIGHSFQKKKIKIEKVQMKFDDLDFLNCFNMMINFTGNNIKKMMTKFNIKKEQFNTFVSSAKDIDIFEILEYVKVDSTKNKKFLKKLKDENLLLLSDYFEEKQKNVIINVGYLPEFCSFIEDSEIVNLDTIYSLYWPFINFGNYYKYNFGAKPGITINMNRYKNLSRNNDDPQGEYSYNNTIGKWIDETKQYKPTIENFNNTQAWSVKDRQLVTNKIFFILNDNKEDNVQYINFSNIYHLFELSDDVPFLSTYLPEEGLYLERVLESQEHDIKGRLKNKNLLQFKVKLPDGILTKKLSQRYFQVNLYENKRMDVQISSTDDDNLNFAFEIDSNGKAKYNWSKIDMVLDKINKVLIKPLNDIGIFNNTVTDKFLKEANRDDNFEIVGINFSFRKTLDFTKEEFMESVMDIKPCLKPFFYEDYKKLNIAKKRFRYKRFENYKNVNELDIFLYIKFNEYFEDMKKVGKEFSEETFTDNIRKSIINSIMTTFDKTFTEAFLLVQRYKSVYFEEFKMRPVSFGTYFEFNVTPVEEKISSKDKKSKKMKNPHEIKISALGVRNLREMLQMYKFMHRLITLIYFLNRKNKRIDPGMRKVVDYFAKQCGSQDSDKEQVEYQEYQGDKTLMDYKRRLSCYSEIKEINEKIKKYNEKEKQLKSRKKKDNTKKIKEITDKKKKLKKMLKDLEKEVKKLKSLSGVKFLPELKSNFSQLDLRCSKCQASLSSKDTECSVCGEPVFASNYGKYCQRTSQPMGTDNSIPPKIIPFNYYREKERFDKWPKCLIQGGGSKNRQEQLTEEVLLNPGKYFSEFTDITVTNPTTCAGYKKTDLKKLGEKYGITGFSKKQDICDEINKIIARNKRIKTGDVQDDDVDYDIVYKMKLSEKVGKQRLNTEFKKDLQKLFKNAVKNREEQYIINNLLSTKSIEKNLDKLVDLFELKNSKQALNKSKKSDNEKKQILIDSLRYSIYKLRNSWNSNQMTSFYKALYPNTEIPNDGKLLESIIKINFNAFKDEHILSQEDIKENDMEVNVLEQYKKFWERMEPNLKKKTKGSFIVKTDKNDNIIQSTFNLNGKAISCPNYTTDGKNPKGLIKFRQIEKINPQELNIAKDDVKNYLCKPCCYVGKRKEDVENDRTLMRQYLFCSGEIDYDTYLKLEEHDSKKQGYISHSESKNNPGALGKLPNFKENSLFHQLFNGFHTYIKNTSNKELKIKIYEEDDNFNLKEPGFLLEGVNQGNKNLFYALSVIFDMDVSKIMNKIIYFFISNKKIHNTLNQGMFSIKFPTEYSFLKYMESDNEKKDLEWFLDLISQPGLFTKEGLNVIVFSYQGSRQKKELTILPPKHVFVEDYYDPNKPTIYLYKYADSNYVEPIIFKFPKKYQDKIIGYYGDKVDEQFIKITKNKKAATEFKTYITELNKFIGKWYFDNNVVKLPNENLVLTAKQTLKYINGKQLVDSFNKVNYILYKNRLIPVKPSGIDIRFEQELIKTNEDIFKYAKSYEDTKEYIKEFRKLLPKKLKDPWGDEFSDENIHDRYKLSKGILDKKRQNIIGVALEFDNILIPIKQVSKSGWKKGTNPDSIFELDINEALFKKKIPALNKEIIKEEFDKENFNRFMLELSHFLSKNKKVKSKIIQFINKYQEYKSDKYNLELAKKIRKIRSRLLNLIEMVFHKIAFPNNNVYEKVLQNEKSKKKDVKNVRHECALYQSQDTCNSDLHCRFDKGSGKCKIHIPIEKVNTIVGKVVEEFLGNTRNAKNMLDSNIDRIVDRLYFKDSKNKDGQVMIYRKRLATDF